MDHIHPIFDTMLRQADKEQLLGQRGLVVWLIGLSGSGKSTLARALEHELYEAGRLTMLLDGDNLRVGVNNNLGFSPADREENIRRAAEVAKLFSTCGVVTICSFISPTKSIRNMAKKILQDAYFEVYIDCPLEVCEKRDVKGLYAKARKGEIPEFTGITAPFEIPENPDLVVNTANLDLAESLTILAKAVGKKITLE